MSKTASSEEAAKELKRKPGEGFKVGQVMYSDDGTRKSTITKIDSETGAVSWRIDQLPGFDKLYDEMDDLVNVAKRVYTKTKDDKKFREFYETARKLRNAIRTHLRNEYPDEYKNIVGINEVDVVDLAPGTQVKAKNYIKDAATFADTMLDISDEILDGESDTIINNPQIKQALNLLKKVGTVKEAYSGFLKNPPEPTPDSEPFNPTGAVAEFREDLRALFGKFKDELNNRKFIGGVAEVMVNWKSLLRSQMNEAFDELDDGFDPEMEALIKSGPRLNKDRFKDVIYYIHNNWMAGNYGDDYAIRRISKYLNALEENVDEASMSGAAGAYLTPYAFRLPRKKKKKEIKEALQLVHVYDKDGKMYGTGSVEKVEGDKTTVRFDGSTVKRFPSDRVKPVKEGVGATLGPGPKAGPDGVTDSAYVKQFKYKLVPKTKNGTYVQKGSGLEVNKLF